MSELRGRCRHCDGYYCDNVGGCPVREAVAAAAPVSPAPYELTMKTWQIERIAAEMQKQQGPMFVALSTAQHAPVHHSTYYIDAAGNVKFEKAY